jgi:hypothetical protein
MTIAEQGFAQHFPGARIETDSEEILEAVISLRFALSYKERAIVSRHYSEIPVWRLGRIPPP